MLIFLGGGGGLLWLGRSLVRVVRNPAFSLVADVGFERLILRYQPPPQKKKNGGGF